MLYVCLVIFNSKYVERNLLVLVIADLDLPLRTIKFCSVVFGVTLRLLVIKTSSSVSREQRTLCLPAMSVTDSAVCITLGGRTVDNTR